jgi:uncharacterized RDD family membrane protein YckC
LNGQYRIQLVLTLQLHRTPLFGRFRIVLNMLFMPFITIADHVFGLTSKRQTLHDKLAKTKVIKQ